jgi:hypothetical protein
MAEQKYRFNPRRSISSVSGSPLAEDQAHMLSANTGPAGRHFGHFPGLPVHGQPKEAKLRRENQQLLLQYELFNKHLGEVETVLGDVRRRDDNIYRVIFEADPIPATCAMAGAGGVNRYKDLDGFASSDVVIGTRSGWMHWRDNWWCSPRVWMKWLHW